ncbi:bifunctional protein FolD [Striga asiatica]|uniref:Bifunctional protein FolD n=1 Tax=Striga asiatica TaxID=4170 RepID=A0A5A7RHQ7_STRAF|nr:bifunctional protein FolD [Striga asiatica]
MEPFQETSVAVRITKNTLIIYKDHFSDAEEEQQRLSSPRAPPGSSKSKFFTRFATVCSIAAAANPIPGQILRPAPNGISSKSNPLKSTVESKNLSGMNLSGSCQHVGSCPMAHALIKTIVSGSISYPIKFTCSRAAWKYMATGGWARKVSLITALRYDILLMSSSVIPFLPFVIPRTSSCSLFITCGWRMSSVITHVRVLAEVSVPAPRTSCFPRDRLYIFDGYEVDRHARDLAFIYPEQYIHKVLLLTTLFLQVISNNITHNFIEFPRAFVEGRVEPVEPVDPSQPRHELPQREVEHEAHSTVHDL